MALEYNPYQKTSILPQDFFMQILQALMYKQMQKRGNQQEQQGNQQSELMKKLFAMLFPGIDAYKTDYTIPTQAGQGRQFPNQFYQNLGR